VHSEQSTEMNQHVNRAFCGGIGSLRILVVCVNGKTRGDHYSVLKWNESFVVTLCNRYNETRYYYKFFSELQDKVREEIHIRDLT
jgi:hypothetical protein